MKRFTAGEHWLLSHMLLGSFVVVAAVLGLVESTSAQGLTGEPSSRPLQPTPETPASLPAPTPAPSVGALPLRPAAGPGRAVRPAGAGHESTALAWAGPEFDAPAPEATGPIGVTAPAPLLEMPSTQTVYLSESAEGADGSELYGAQDVLIRGANGWKAAFHGERYRLNPLWQDIKSLAAAPGRGLVMSFAANRRKVAGLGPVDGSDLVYWDGGRLSLYFDGSDVGLNALPAEKIDALEILPGKLSPVGKKCLAYLLISTQGAGQVSGRRGQAIAFAGEDVLGFCATKLGDETIGLWHMVFDGSAAGLTRRALVNLAVSEDGRTLYMMLRHPFVVPGGLTRPGQIISYNLDTGVFGGPYFDAEQEGIPGQVDALALAHAAD